mmetsp:Transcript_24033/g.81156  ORF Transcript_24033/g.81156 Transcript_24033/m.81156 type:complete len:240 (-) Transcript_24033:459-1178(-)
MGNFCPCELDVTEVTFAEMKKRMEGETRQVRRNPAVFVTIHEVTLEGGGSIKFSPQKFSLRGLEIYTTVEVKGTAAELTAFAAGKAQDVAMEKLFMSAKTKASIKAAQDKAAAAGGKVAGGVMLSMGKIGAAISSKAGGMMDSVKKVKVHVTVDMHKEFGTEEVQVTVRGFQSDVKVVGAILTVDKAKLVVEAAISQKASEVATKMAKKKTDQAYEKINGLPQAAWDAAGGASEAMPPA